MRNWFLTIAQAFFAVVVLSVVVGLVVWQFLPSPDFEKFATAFGDMAGSVFSAFAFAGLIVTALMQREELSLQRKEQQATQEELKRSADAMAAQLEVSQWVARLESARALFNHYSEIWEAVVRANTPEAMAEVLERHALALIMAEERVQHFYLNASSSPETAKDEFPIFRTSVEHFRLVALIEMARAHDALKDQAAEDIVTSRPMSGDIAEYLEKKGLL